MGKKNRPMPNNSNNKDAILKRAAIDSLDKQLSEKKELVAEVQDWIARKAEKEAEQHRHNIPGVICLMELLQGYCERYGSHRESWHRIFVNYLVFNIVCHRKHRWNH